jgi:NADH-quinone oxidoreductase subunit L
MSQTLQTTNLLAVPLAPLVGSVLAGVFGTHFGGNWLGRRITHSLTILGVLWHLFCLPKLFGVWR